ncbi:MAG: hypothetical protein M1546_06435, partial [Chloroflexi bacterium]|nr:hypothetical protein [Chloroflexota bacterium]
AAEWAIGEVFELWLCQHDSAPVVFNVNVPNVPAAALAGVQLTSFSQHSFLTNYRFEQQEGTQAGTLSVICKNNGRCAQLEMWTDAWAVARGYVSVTPMRTFPDLISIAPWAEPAAAIPVTAFNPTLTRA